jgi:hypothetical protein
MQSLFKAQFFQSSINPATHGLANLNPIMAPLQFRFKSFLAGKLK